MPILHSFKENKLEYEDEDEVEIKMMGTGMDKDSLEHNLYKNDITSNEESLDELMAEPEELPEPWTLFIDGSSCIDGSVAELILTNPEGVEFTYAIRFWFEVTNNEAEYEALIAGLQIAEQMGVKNLQANVDSCLRSTAEREQKADALSDWASISFATTTCKQVLVEELKEKSIHERIVLAIVDRKTKHG
ncbi:reverse transcriptase domain-containing protein [Tanacetum coccineum]